MIDLKVCLSFFVFGNIIFGVIFILRTLSFFYYKSTKMKDEFESIFRDYGTFYYIIHGDSWKYYASTYIFGNPYITIACIILNFNVILFSGLELCYRML